MTTTQPCSTFFSTFDDSTCLLLLEALARAYETGCENYDVDRGSNEATFAYGLYHYAAFQLAELEATTGGLIKAVPNAHCHQVGKFEVLCRRVAHNIGADISSSFPNNDGLGYVTGLGEQLYLPASWSAPSLSTARRLYLAHMGNADDGLGAAYLCFPDPHSGQRFSWAYTQQIYSAAESPIIERVLETAANIPQEKELDEPQVHRRRKKLNQEE